MPEKASAEEGLDCRHNHWRIESKRPWGRDVVFAEDAFLARKGNLPHTMKALRNTTLTVLRFNGYTRIAETLRLFNAKSKLEVNLIL